MAHLKSNCHNLFVEEWDVLSDPVSMSNHSYVLFKLKFGTGSNIYGNHIKCKFDYRKVNWDKFSSTVFNGIRGGSKEKS